MSIIAVYGSLRKGEYNYERFGGDKSFAYKGTFNIPGFKLYSLGPYPAVIEGDKTDKLIVDILETTKDIAKSINNMEVGAGYSAEEVMVDGQVATIYVYDHPIKETNRVLSGDWSKYITTGKV